MLLASRRGAQVDTCPICPVRVLLRRTHFLPDWSTMAQVHPSIQAKTGGAQIEKVGHTTSGQFGTEYRARPKGRQSATPISPNA